LKIEIAKPPLFDRIAVVFPQASSPGVIFAWGDTIYNPSGVDIPRFLHAHEEVHGSRQRLNGVEKWWEAYLSDPEFRYVEELKAHVAEYRAQVPLVHDRNQRAKLLQATALRLTAPLYAYGSKAPSLSVALSHLRYELR